ncbi:MAG: hypothetical protein WC155_00560 [Candidatus Cloacimonadales bacterium]
MLGIVVTAIALLVISCGVFKPRDSEDPEKPVPWNSYPITREQIMENLEHSYNYSENTFKYAEIFTTDFSFQFASQDITEHGTPSALNIEQEQEMLVLLHKSITAYNQKIHIDSLVAIENQNDSITSNSATLYRRYHISVGDKNTQVYQGKAEFELIFVPEVGQWRIKIWKDFRSTTNQTWGKLKNEYTQ